MQPVAIHLLGSELGNNKQTSVVVREVETFCDFRHEQPEAIYAVCGREGSCMFDVLVGSVFFDALHRRKQSRLEECSWGTGRCFLGGWVTLSLVIYALLYTVSCRRLFVGSRSGAPAYMFSSSGDLQRSTFLLCRQDTQRNDSSVRDKELSIWCFVARKCKIIWKLLWMLLKFLL